jgi:ABC-type nitrate/sulfonate/bicarbonate transport system substrate-binding protein
MDQAKSGALRVNSFRGMQNLPLIVAMREGYLAARGLMVELSYTTGSAAQLAGLVRGDFDLIQTAPDNVVNVDTQPAAFDLDTATDPQVVMVMGGSVGVLGVYARPGVTTIAGLRGASLGVDNPTSGFAIVLRDLLQRQGLALDRDYHFIVAGGTHARCDALLAGTIAATILYLPFDLRAAGHGCTLLASSADVYAAYASGSTAGVRPWLEAHEEAVTGYIEAILLATRWIHDPVHAEVVWALLRLEPALGVAPELVEQTYTRFVTQGVRDGTGGMGLGAPLDEPGIRQVIALRGQYGTAGARLGQPAEYSDPRWYRLAQACLPSQTERTDGY